MRIKSIEYENFRNFKDHGKIECATDGRVTIIYGKNGDGKTTLHQLFQWIFYGQVHFNKTTTGKLYNLSFEEELEWDTHFKVMGRIEFDHAGESYCIRRTAEYVKEIGSTKFVGEEFVLSKKGPDNDYHPQNKAKETIEKLLPSGLSEYFFFDGESMIADLKVKGDDSANKLKEALYSIFDLDVLDNAIDHIGATNLKKTVLGKLYLSKGDSSSGGAIATVKSNIENIQSKLEQRTESLKKNQQEKEKNNAAIKEISERIGSTKSRAEYERQRKQFQKQQELFQKNVEMAQANFGDYVADAFTRLLISKAVNDAKNRIKLKIENTSLPTGLTKPLIEHLLGDEVRTCICGNPLCEEEKDHIREYLKLLPPKSFSSLYHEYSRTAKQWGSIYERDKIEGYIKQTLDNAEQVNSCDEQIREIDIEQKKSADIENLVVARQEAEANIVKLTQKIEDDNIEIRKLKVLLKKEMAEFDKLSKDDLKTQEALRRIDIMETVLAHFKNQLDVASEKYSNLLEENIQSLVDAMLRAERKVSVSKDFTVKVFDNHGDEAKSEGQFAVVSFAYIGGILKLLQSQEGLAEKEYPLVLDGPFSKLDPDQRQNVVDVVPEFAPQIILFSKDSLQDVFSEKQIGRIWTIKSNEQQNIAEIKEGYLWN